MCISFTAQELNATATELGAKIHEFLAKNTEPDVLLGSHPAVTLASQKQSIAIWHGSRIETHLSDWINRIPHWKAATRHNITIGPRTYNIDNLAHNANLQVVLAVEAKRIWINQDSGSMRDVRDRCVTCNQYAAQIISYVHQANSQFRFFVFDVFGKTKKGSKGLPIVAGDKIQHIFGKCLWSYLQWEREVMKDAIMEKVDPANRNSEQLDMLRCELIYGTDGPCISNGQEIIGYIDRHAEVQK
jgi:hypothetical protein